MKVYKFICPGCSREYKITAHNNDAPKGEFSCKCSFKAPLAVVLKWSNEISGEKQKNDEQPATQIKDTENGNSQQHLATKVNLQSVFLTCTNDGSVIPLKTGKYTIGRKSSDSTADVKLTSDIGMSRIHAEISISNDGNCIIKPLNAQNPVFLNKKSIAFGTTAEISANDTIQLGNSIFVLNKK